MNMMTAELTQNNHHSGVNIGPPIAGVPDIIGTSGLVDQQLFAASDGDFLKESRSPIENN